MSRKKADLRLKKKAESSVSCDTAPGGVQDSGSSRSFKTVNSLSAEKRILLHRLLLGKLPQKMSPFPVSQLAGSSPAVDSSSKESPQSLHKSGEEDLKWTPLPAPNIATLVGRLAPIRLSMEQLCAPLAKEEEVEKGYVASNSTEKRPTDDTTVSLEHKSSNSLDSDPLCAPAALPKECLVQGASSHTASVSSSVLTQEPSSRNSSPLPSRSLDGYLALTQKSSASNLKQDSTVGKVKGKSISRVSPLKFSQHIKPKHHSDDVIDLTDSPHPPKMARATTMNTFRGGCGSDTYSGRSGVEQSTSLPSVKEPVESQREDIDSLCMDIDIDTIEDFSDDNSDLGPSDCGPGLGKGRSRTSGGRGASGSDGQSISGLKGSIVGTGGKTWASKGKSRMLDDNQLVKSGSGSSAWTPGSLPGQSALSTRAMADSSPSTRSTFTCPTTPSNRGGSSGQRTHTADSSSSSGSRFSYPTPTTSRGNSTGQKRHHNTADAAIGAKKLKMDTSRSPQTSVTASHSHKPRTAPSTGGHATPSEHGGIVEEYPKSGASWGATGNGGGGGGGGGSGSGSSSSGGTVQTSQLETCPMCNTHFPTWYTQLDADGHIAQCLQAVMDLEMAHDLVLD